MLDAPVGFAFTAGTIAAFNPCGFALLPAYLGMYLAGDDSDDNLPSDGNASAEARPMGHPVSAAQVLGRAAVVAVAVVAGFVTVFGVAAVLISQTAVTVQEYTPWLTLIIGAALVPVGMAMLRGWTPKIRLPALRRRVTGTDPIAMFWFGVSYATVSLSCTIPAFLVAVVGTFSTDGTGSGALVFTAYTAGMASVLVTITVIVATARHGMLTAVRRVLPYVNTAAGGLAVLAGAYVAYYGWYEIQINRGNHTPEGPITLVRELSASVTTWIDALPTAALITVPLAITATLGALLFRSRRTPSSTPDPFTDSTRK